MESSFFASNTTDSTFFTMKNSFFLCLIVIEYTNVTIVNSESFITFLASIAFWLLFLASHALYCCYFVAFKLMILFRIHLRFIHNFVMAESARVKLSFAYFIWTLFLTPSFIVFASKCYLLFIKFCFHHLFFF